MPKLGLSIVAAVSAVALACLPGAGWPEPRPTDGLCPGGLLYGVLRINRITPRGSEAGFARAVRDQLAWYRSHGYADNDIAAYPIMSNGGHALVMTLHRRPPEVPAGRQDAAWRAFVREFRSNADVVETKMVCLSPKGAPSLDRRTIMIGQPDQLPRVRDR